MRIIASIALLFLAGCATVPSSPVSVRMATPPGLTPAIASISVVPEPGEVDWAAEQSLRQVGVVVDGQSPWRLRASERTVLRPVPYSISCAYPAWRGGYDPWYWGSPWNDPWCMERDRYRQQRIITWIIEDAAGRVYWQASASERTQQPPLAASMHLAQAFSTWRSGVSPVP